MELAVVGAAFDAVAVRAVPFDHPWVGAVTPWWVGSFDDFFGGFFERYGKSFRGKNPPGW
jgi:hypothetical protein